MPFPSDVPVAAVGTPVAGTRTEKFALTQTVEVVPLGQTTIVAMTVLGNGTEEMITETKKRFQRATPGAGAWAEVTL